ncbi:MAG: hypothetical protein ACFFD4_39695 [Candidatus Odinarchaeota archaeon]
MIGDQGKIKKEQSNKESVKNFFLSHPGQSFDSQDICQYFGRGVYLVMRRLIDQKWLVKTIDEGMNYYHVTEDVAKLETGLLKPLMDYWGIELVLLLHKICSEELLDTSMQLYKLSITKPFGKFERHLALFLCAVEILLEEQGLMIREKMFGGIGEKTGVQLTIRKVDKHRKRIKKTYISICGREKARTSTYNRWKVVKNLVIEYLQKIPASKETREEVKKISLKIIDELAKMRLTIRDMELKAWMILKLACEELKLVNKDNWAEYLGIDDELKARVYTIAWKHAMIVKNSNYPEVDVISREAVSKIHQKNTSRVISG